MDPRTLKDKATELFSKGKFAKSAETYELYCKAEPKDLQSRLRMGDAWAKSGKKDRAIIAYQAAAEGFARDGFLPRAIAASKLVLELDPAHTGIAHMLADLYARKSGSSRPSTARTIGSKQEPAPSPRSDSVAASVEAGTSPANQSQAPVESTSRVEAVDVALEGTQSELSKSPLEPLTSSDGIEIELETQPITDEIEVPILDDEFAVEPPPQVAALDSEPPPAPPSLEPRSLVETQGPVVRGAPPEPAAVDIPLSPKADDEAVVLTRKRVEPPITSSPSGATSAPPGLKPKRHEPAEPPRSTPSGARIWLPPTFLPPASSQSSVTDSNSVPVPRSEGSSTQTELERSLEVLAQLEFDAEATRSASQPEVERSAASAPHEPKAPGRAGFTELELEGDSLLQAVEAAAALGVGAASEERLEAPDDLKLEAGALPKIPLFSDLPEDAFIALFDRCPLHRAEPGGRIIEQGTQGTSFFVICAGKVRVLRADGETTRELALLEEGAFFGEMALLSDAPRSASVEAAAEDTQLLEIPANVLTELSSRHPTVAAALKKFCRQRLLANLMNSASLFKPFTKSERRDLVQRFRARDVVEGEVLIHEGQPSDGLYVVLTGEVEVVMGNRRVATLREGQVFGEISLLTRSPTSATVKATRRTSFLRLPREDFDELIMSHPQILEQVAELTDERRKTNASLLQRPDATALMV
jgi:CRP-like cAMP-binding protein